MKSWLLGAGAAVERDEEKAALREAGGRSAKSRYAAIKSELSGLKLQEVSCGFLSVLLSW